MKKIFVIVVLFALPIVVYLFFASGVHNFAKLPVLTEEPGDLEGFETIAGEQATLDGNITILGFYGQEPAAYSANSFNLAQKIYDNYFKFKDFQLLIVVPEGTEEEVRDLQEDLEEIVDLRKWKFVFGDPEEIRVLYSGLDTDIPLQDDLSTPYVFLLDKEARLRGRNDDEDEPDGLLYGYDTRSVAFLDDKMNDDVKVMLAEYRLALKKYNKDQQ